MNDSSAASPAESPAPELHDDFVRHLQHLRIERRLAARTLTMYTQAFHRLQRFAGVAADRLASGRLRLAGSSAWFDCALVQVIPAGDHDILLGEVRDFGCSTLPPLIFAQGQLLPGRQLAPAAEAL